jgi:tetratricopeptide (TPR) repeat protein
LKKGEKLRQISRDRVIALTSISLIALIVLSCPVIGAAIHYGKVDKSDYYYAYDMADNILETPGPNAVVLVDTDNTHFPCRYLQVIKKKRIDVRVINPEAAGVPGFQGADLLGRTVFNYQAKPGATSYEQIAERNSEEFPIYTAVVDAIGLGWNLEWRGFLLRLLPQGARIEDSSGAPSLYTKGKKEPYSDLDSDAREAIELPSIQKANLEFSREQYQAASDIYKGLTTRFGNDLYVPTLYSCGTFSVLHEFWGQALQRLRKYKDITIFLPQAVTINPDFYSLTLARAYFQMLDYSAALAELNGYISFNPNDAAARALRGQIYFLLKEYGSAVKEFEKAARIETNNPKYHYFFALALPKEK